MQKKVIAALIVAMGGLLLAHSSFARPILLELFTSEGCSSCPAGEATISELNERDDFFALSFHVDYWDKLGWKDRFAKREFTNRQGSYMRAFGSRRIYTPQAVIDGADDTTASWGWRVKMLAHSLRKTQIDIPINLKDNTVNLSAYKLNEPVDIWYVTYNDKEETDVKAGENRGERLASVNVVRSLVKLADWDGSEVSFNLPKISDAGHKTAIFIQENGLGRILGLQHN